MQDTRNREARQEETATEKCEHVFACTQDLSATTICHTELLCSTQPCRRRSNVPEVLLVFCHHQTQGALQCMVRNFPPSCPPLFDLWQMWLQHAVELSWVSPHQRHQCPASGLRSATHNPCALETVVRECRQGVIHCCTMRPNRADRQISSRFSIQECVQT